MHCWGCRRCWLCGDRSGAFSCGPPSLLWAHMHSSSGAIMHVILALSAAILWAVERSVRPHVGGHFGVAFNVFLWGSHFPRAWHIVQSTSAALPFHQQQDIGSNALRALQVIALNFPLCYRFWLSFSSPFGVFCQDSCSGGLRTPQRF